MQQNKLKEISEYFTCLILISSIVTNLNLEVTTVIVLE